MREMIFGGRAVLTEAEPTGMQRTAGMMWLKGITSRLFEPLWGYTSRPALRISGSGPV